MFGRVFCNKRIEMTMKKNIMNQGRNLPLALPTGDSWNSGAREAEGLGGERVSLAEKSQEALQMISLHVCSQHCKKAERVDICSVGLQNACVGMIVHPTGMTVDKKQ